MTCEKCGEVCQCPMEPPPIDSPAPDASIPEPSSPFVAEGAGAAGDDWRNELSARLSSYRSRRKAPPPRYPSLRLPFGQATSALKIPTFEQPVPAPPVEEVPDSALQADHRAPITLEAAAPIPQEQLRVSPPRPASTSGAKIIEFPRFAWAPPAPPPDQLAEPVMDVPRILEVPEIAPAPPALGGITIEPTPIEESRKRPGVDSPLRNAPLGQRLLASAIDVLIIAGASALFGFVFWKIALVRPPQIQLITLVAAVPCVFWAVYQYLLIVYSGSTPGLRVARLQLAKFDGKPTTRSLRRWRILAAYLSAASLGMGYVWLFLDEDALCWHDRITHTCLAPRK